MGKFIFLLAAIFFAVCLIIGISRSIKSDSMSIDEQIKTFAELCGKNPVTATMSYSDWNDSFELSCEIEKMKSNWKIVREDAKTLVIKDCGPWDKYKTVTNDIEHVVRYLDQNNILRDRELMYYDSEGFLDEVIHNNGRFVCFKPTINRRKL